MFLGILQKPRNGEIYNMGGGRFSNCSIIEALNLVEEISKVKVKRKILRTPRVGDHIWYISDTSKFKNIILIGNKLIIQKKLLKN